MQRLAGVFLIVGSSLFLIGPSRTSPRLFYTEPDVRKRLEIVEADPSGWAMMSLGCRGRGSRRGRASALRVASTKGPGRGIRLVAPSLRALP